MYVQLFKTHQYHLNPITIIISIHLVLLINIPCLQAQGNYTKYYSDCSRATTLRCGEAKFNQIHYPFWGENIRPSYCGLEGFKLSCENNNLVMDIGSSSKFRVVNFFHSTVLIERYYDDHHLNDTTCDPKFNTTILNKKLFEYDSKSTEDLFMFYGCSLDLHVPVRSGIRNNFTCENSNGNEKKQVIFGVQSLLKDYFDRLNKSCKTSIRVPVNRIELEIYSNLESMSLEDLLVPSFRLQYKINHKSCSDCRKLREVCWKNTDLGEDPKCLRQAGNNIEASRRGETMFLRPNIDLGKTENSRLKIGIAGGGAIICLFSLVLFVFICYRRMKTRHGSTFYPKDVETFISKYGSSKPRRYSYATLKKITYSFKEELGKGGCGNVYKGRLSDGRVVAVKVLNATKGNGEDFMNEVASIGRTSHVNVVTLLGYVYEGKKRALIYEFMPNGSLEKFIHKTTPLLKGQYLSWETLYSIALGIARGLEYLHCGCNTQILHFDIKPHNILLDKDFCPKISDFGLAKLYTREQSVLSYSIMQARGTIGYIAPEVISRNFGPVSHKSDVYSYGMVIHEMVGGRKNVDTRVARTSEIYYPRWVYKHINLNEETSSAENITEEENHIVRKMMIVGLWCIQSNPAHRPSISKVIEMFEGDLAALEIPPKPYMCSPPTSPSNVQQKTFSSSSSQSKSYSSLDLVPRSN